MTSIGNEGGDNKGGEVMDVYCLKADTEERDDNTADPIKVSIMSNDCLGEEVVMGGQADVSCAAAPRSPSLRQFCMAPNFPEDDGKEIIGAWIWMFSRMARLVAANNTNEASS